MPTVTSADGTEIAYDVTGHGPAVILVDGAIGFRTFGSAPALAALLAGACRVYTYDRRGRGESGDSGATTDVLEREVEDIDALIEVAGGAASLYGISSGGALVLEAAARLGSRVASVAVYEIPYDSSEAGTAAWRAYCAELAELLHRETAAVLSKPSCGWSVRAMRVCNACVNHPSGRRSKPSRRRSPTTPLRSAKVAFLLWTASAPSACRPS
ncbi:alpha/beta hydrolase [Candidatus Aeolococcus gillhamiae]|uniref:alpha/beta fold hydrolase n=1 Tax=Candidatus Aeolococcus gillhamiae TaxID=3127015 RepID=UPI003077516E